MINVVIFSTFKRKTFQDKWFKEVQESKEKYLSVRESKSIRDVHLHQVSVNLCLFKISVMVLRMKNLKKEKMIDSKYTFQ